MRRIFAAVSADKHEHDPLSRRERQIMDVIWRAGRATATEIHERLPDAPSYSAVRALPVSYTHLTLPTNREV